MQKEPDLRKGRETALAFLEKMSRNLDSNDETGLIDRATQEMAVRDFRDEQRVAAWAAGRGAALPRRDR